jgi:dihydrodipicolinate synthase/N-acetylneuraminate lyase
MHTEMLVDAYLDLHESGKLTNRRKNIDRGKGAFAFSIGGKGLYEWADRNPGIASYPVDYTNDPAVIAANDNVVAIKDDFCGEFGRRMSLLVHDKWAVYSGGMKQNFLDLLPYGCDGYLSTLVSFKPEISHQFWQAVQTKDLQLAGSIVQKFDTPYFDYICALPGNFDAGIHATYELHNICQRWRRSPYYNLNDQEMEQLQDFLKSHSLL